MFIGLSLSITGQLRSSASAYAIVGLDPAFVTDFGAEFYRKSGATSTFSDSITHSRAGNATMVDSDGLLKWAPHNLVLYSEAVTNWQSFGHATVSVSDGVFTLVEAITTAGHSISQACSSSSQVDLVVDIKANGRTKGRLDAGTSSLTYGANFDLVAETIDTAGSAITASSIVALSDGWYRLTIRSTDSNVFRILIKDDTGAITYTGDGVSGFLFRYPHAYRSDLGGMVNNPDRGDSYVPTTSSAVYLPRRGHHVYNGDSWVNKGLLHESEARTNLVTYSEDFTQWTTSGVTVDSNQGVGPDGSMSLDRINVAATSGEHHVRLSVTTSPSTTYAFSTVMKNDGEQYAFLALYASGSAWATGVFDLSTGDLTDSSATGFTFVGGQSEDLGGGLYRCTVVITTSASAATLAIIGAAGDATPASYISGSPNFTAIEGEDVLTGFAQLEVGNAGASVFTPSSYMPTNGSQYTRAAETLTVPAANLPWPSPVVIGEELVTNGTFDSDFASWSDYATPVKSVSGGVASVTGDNGEGIFQNIAVQSGKVYEVKINFISKAAAAQIVLYSGAVSDGATSGSLLYASPNDTSVGQITRVLVASTNTFGVLVWSRAAANTFTFDNISVKEINPLSVSIQMQGEMTYADDGTAASVSMYRWYVDGNNRLGGDISGSSGGTGALSLYQVASGVVDTVLGTVSYFTPGVNVPFNIASRHGSTFINGAVDGTALTADTTPVALPDLSATDLQLGYDYMGTIKLFRIWADDLTDAGIAEASAPSTVPSLSLTFDGQSTSFTDGGLVV